VDVHILQRRKNVSGTEVSLGYLETLHTHNLFHIHSQSYHCSVAPAEITLAFAYMFRNFEISLPEGHMKPDALDHFTLAYQKPGLPVVFKPRQ